MEAYWYSFYDNSITSDHTFIPGTTFDLIWKYYRFDRRLRVHISHALERIEISFRTQFAYYLSQYYVPFPLNQNNFQFSSEEWKTEKSVLHMLCKESNEQFAKHYFRKYTGDILPIWALVEIFSFGAIIRYYNKLNSIPLKQQISSVYGLNPTELRSWLDHLRHIRNICAHHSRLWNKRIVQLPRPPQRVIANELNHFWIHKPQSKEINLHHNDRRIFNTILIIDFFLSKTCPQNTWREELVQLINEYSIDVKRMGFPENWDAHAYWKFAGRTHA